MVEIFDSKKEEKMPPQDQEIVHRHVDDYSEVLRLETPATNVCASYLPKPVSFAFDSQERSEHVLLVLRQHPFTQVKKIVIGIVMFFLPMFLSSVGLFGFLPGSYQFAFVIMWWIATFGFFFSIFLTWFFSVYIITDERLIDVDFLSLIYKDVATAKLDKIEDISAVTGGAIQSMFDYGTIKIQTAGSSVTIDFEHVPHPAKVMKLLNELQLEEERERIEGRTH